MEAYSPDGKRIDFDPEGMEHAKRDGDYWLSSLPFKGGLKSLDADGVVAAKNEESALKMYDFYKDLTGVAFPPDTEIYLFKNPQFHSLLFKIPNLQEPGDEFDTLLDDFNVRLNEYADEKVPEDLHEALQYCFRVDACDAYNWGVASDGKLYVFDIEAAIPSAEYLAEKYGAGDFLTVRYFQCQPSPR